MRTITEGVLSKMMLAMAVILIWHAVPVHSSNRDLGPYAKQVFDIIDENCPKKNYFRPNHTYFEIVKLKGDEIGLCDRSQGWYQISMDRKFWEDSDDLAKFAVMAHEITHCALRFDHSMNIDNYMYYTYMGELTRAEIISQLIVYTRKVCD